jgi:hypothetical protein
MEPLEDNQELITATQGAAREISAKLGFRGKA